MMRPFARIGTSASALLLFLLLCSGGALAVEGSPAIGFDSDRDGRSGRGLASDGDFNFGLRGDSPNSGSERSTGAGSTQPAVDDGLVTIRYSAVVRTAEGVCLGSGFEEVDRADADEVRLLREEATVLQYESLISRGVQVPACVGPDNQPTVDLSRAVAFADEVRGRLPRPVLSMPPGEAVAGLEMYLVNDQALTYSETQVVDLGGMSVPVTVEATGSWRVDWGDGTSDPRVHEQRSVGYEDRHGGYTVTHVWQDRGQYTVAVTDAWTLRISVPGLTPITLPAVDLASVSLPMRVGEVQAVITR
jgi:hypothetical protein